MTNNIKSFSNFSIFFSTSFLLFWPYALVVIGSSLSVALFLTWQGDFIVNSLALWNGNLTLSDDISLVFLMPAILLFGLPLWFLWGGGTLQAEHQAFLSSLNELISTPFGFIGFSLTSVIAVGFILWSLNCAKNILEISWQKASIYLTILAILISAWIIL